jgi:hypothetical protein
MIIIEDPTVTGMQNSNKMFVSCLGEVGFFLLVLVPPVKKSGRHNITEILLKVVLNTITLTLLFSPQWDTFTRIKEK